jgi:hypothetical protein
MPDLKRFWQDVRAIERSLPKFSWLVSIENEERGHVGGRIAEVPAGQAALLLHEKSHRVATEEEIGAHHAQEEEVHRQLMNDQLRREGIAVVVSK